MDELTVGRIRRTHGLTGEMQVQSETNDGPNVFSSGRRFQVRGAGKKQPHATLTLKSSRPHKGGFLLQFDGRGVATCVG